MRVLVVSSHYPPNFVSGGTLAPQRLARAIRARGHDVSVYAGWLGDRPPLASWAETDETGLPVTWLVTTPWTGWSDDRNYDNPEVASDFARHLDEVRPDIVHFHSLQSMGVGLVDVATAAGVATVVTMHDFWWTCGRQFLVDRDYRPCCLVTSCGVCPCEVDAAWRDRRAVRLRRSLESVDVVLAVSQSAAAVLDANGVAGSRLEVDENAVPAGAVSDAPPREREDRMRFVYCGGSDRMKGVHVLWEAVRGLSGVSGWSLDAYAATEFAAEDPLDPDLPVVVHPPFAPDQLERVFARADVLVLPSVMRESYSILTREALLRGVPVIATETIGPEEVVIDGRNGLLVPPDDPGALAAAMRRLVADGDLLRRLRDGIGGITVRTVEDQVEGLEARYEAALDRRRTATSAPRRIRQVLFLVGIHGAPLRYRAHLPAEGLSLLGVHAEVRHYRDPEAERLAEAADVVVVYRVPATTQILDLIARVRADGRPVLFDVDDLIFDPEIRQEIPALSLLPPDEAALWLEGVRRYRTTMESCDGFIGSTAALCRHAADVVGLPTWSFANGVGAALSQVSDAALAAPRRPGPPRIGYFSGTNTHDHDWRFVEASVLRVMIDRPEVELWLGGLVTPTAALDAVADRIHRLPFVEWTQLPALLRDIDVNLAPLEPGSRFNEAKSAIKWLEAALVETPTVASPTEPFRSSIDHLVTGALAETPGEWEESIRRLLDDEDLRGRIGRAARRRVLLEWSPHLQGRRYLAILEAAAVRSGGRTSWVAVAHDEPPEHSPLELYPPNDLLSSSSPTGAAPPDVQGRPIGRREMVERAVARGRWILEDRGPAAAAAAGGRMARRQVARALRRLRRAAARSLGR